MEIHDGSCGDNLCVEKVNYSLVLESPHCENKYMQVLSFFSSFDWELLCEEEDTEMEDELVSKVHKFDENIFLVASGDHRSLYKGCPIRGIIHSSDKIM